jgi:very-short-patch-repair endonuclease
VINQNQSYPIILLPDFLQKFCHQYPLAKALPRTPKDIKLNQVSVVKTEKELVKINQSIVLNEFKRKMIVLRNLIGLLWIGWIMGVVLIGFLGITWGLSGLAVACFMGAYCCLIVVLYGWVKVVRLNWLKRWHLQQKQLEQSNSDVVDSDSPSSSDESEQSIRYLQNFGFNSDSIKVSDSFQEMSIEGLLAQRWLLLRQLLKDKVKPIGCSQARQGVSEREFGQYLQLFFDEVIQGAEFQVSWTSRGQLSRGRFKRKSKSKSNYNYSADFLVIHPLTGLGLDVEVDEPYSLLTKEPTHCVDRPQERWRNQFFLESGWVVVRFSERQVVEAPRSCCQAIAQVIFEITGDRRYLQQLEGEPELLPEQLWTVREARRRAKSNYRLLYLPQSVKESMQIALRKSKLRR